ncbi:MAG: hypothetical protein AAFV77_10435, partial [Planctomycetota bacterium]
MRALAAAVVGPLLGLSICLQPAAALGQGTLGAFDVSSDPDMPYEYFDGLRFDPAVPTPEGIL